MSSKEEKYSNNNLFIKTIGNIDLEMVICKINIKVNFYFKNYAKKNLLLKTSKLL